MSKVNPFDFDSQADYVNYLYHGKTRQFETGATRDTDEGKFDYEGFLSPLVVERFGAYMHKHRHQSDGTLRDSDNWQRGIPLTAYIKSSWRHFLSWWKHHRGYPSEEIEDTLCAVIFNASGYLHEILRAKLEDGKEHKDS